MTTFEILDIANKLFPLPYRRGPWENHWLYMDTDGLHLVIKYCGHRFRLGTSDPKEWEALDRETFIKMLEPHVEHIKMELYPAEAQEAAEFLAKVIDETDRPDWLT